MITDSVEQQYRRFLLILSGVIFAGTVAELVFVEHTADLPQWIPFVLCGLGAGSVLAIFLSPSPAVIRVHRVLMGIIMAGGLYGFYEHFHGNYAFYREIQPNATAGEALLEALFGSVPLMAPGIVIIAALLAFAAVWRHPVLEMRSGEN